MLGIVGFVSQGEEKMFTLMSEQIFTPMKMTIYSVLNKVTKISSFFAYLSCAVHQWSSSPVAFQAAHHEHFEISHMLSVRWNLQPWSFNRWNYCFLRRLEMRQTARNEKKNSSLTGTETDIFDAGSHLVSFHHHEHPVLSQTTLVRFTCETNSPWMSIMFAIAN